MTGSKIAVIGAGPAGLTAAYELSKRGFKVHVYEATDSVGGMAKTLNLWNQKVDIGPHRFFSSDDRVNRIWLEVVENDYKMVNRLTRIFYKKRFFFYPLKPFNALFNLGVFEAMRCISSYGRHRLFPLKNDGSFENWVVNRFGRRLFDIFFKSYTEKLWGITCKELDADFAAQRIKKLSLYEAIKNSFFKGDNKHKTLVDQFAYPLKGTGTVYQNMAKKINSLGGKILLSSPVFSVLVEDKVVKGIKLESGEDKIYDEVVSSMPITNLIERLTCVPEEIKRLANELKFRNTIIVYLKIDRSHLFPDQWLYIHDAEVQMGRITNFQNWVSTLYGEEKNTILAVEYWCYDNDDIWESTDDMLISQAKQDVLKTRLIKNVSISEGHVYRIPKSYPVYDQRYKERLSPIEEYVDQIKGLSLIGRYGAFKYNNQDHSILMGLLAAENISEGKKHNLWLINTDYEYQEASVITETGLKKTSN